MKSLDNYKNVVIGVQARVSSQRFRGKVFERLSNGVSVIDSCLFNAFSAKDLFESQGYQTKVEVYLLVPIDEEKIWSEKVESFNYENECNLGLHLGHPTNVFERYKSLYLIKEPDYIMRITGDCPMVPFPVIARLLKTAITGYHDYIANVDSDLRSFPDGTDIEAISSSLMRWGILKEPTMTEYEKEHVTPLFRNSPPDWASIAHVGVSGADESHLKFSIDTREDLKRLNNLIEKKAAKRELAKTKGVRYYEF